MTDARAIERASSYRNMMDSWAWKDFHGSVLKEIRQEALEKAIVAETMDQVQMARGYVKCLDSIESQLGYILGE